MKIQTKRLDLIACQPSHLRALAQGKAELEKILGIKIAEGWPQFVHAYKPPAADIADANTYAWGTLLFIDVSAAMLVGSGGFKGGPNPEGMVELGYEIAPGLWNQGYASEAVQGMLRFAFADNNVRQVIAHTLGEENASNKVLRKNGFEFAAESTDPDHGTIWQWQITKSGFYP